MIPLRIELKNFMSYGEDVPALDLSGMHTVCLSGENGNGKSALLDAITWSLWGESRAGKNKHDDLVRIGADEMSVLFMFEMDGQRYRTLRKRSKRASGNQWELQQQTPDQGLGTGWRSLTGNNAGETEKAIHKLLRMSYDTFINSAYLRQGQADQFVRQTPGKRKEILADILDLSRYDQLEAKARERSREAGAEATDLEREIHVIDAELAGEEAHREALIRLQARRQELHDQQEALKTEWAALSDRKGQLSGQKQFADSLTAQVAALRKEMAELGQELAEQGGELDTGRDLP
jgi:exonuclease SbcC